MNREEVEKKVWGMLSSGYSVENVRNAIMCAFDAIAPSSAGCAKSKPVETDASKRYEDALQATNDSIDVRLSEGPEFTEQYVDELLMAEREAAAAVIEELRSAAHDGHADADQARQDRDSLRDKLAEAGKKATEAGVENAWNVGAARIFRSRAELAEHRLGIAREGLQTILDGGEYGDRVLANETLKRIDGAESEKSETSGAAGPASTIGKPSEPPASAPLSLPDEVVKAREKTDRELYAAGFGSHEFGSPNEVKAERAAADALIAAKDREIERLKGLIDRYAIGPT